MNVTAAKSEPKQEAAKCGIQIVKVTDSVSHSESEAIAARHGGRLPTLQEFLMALGDQQQYGKSVNRAYWLGGRNGIRGPYVSRVDHKTGELRMTDHDTWSGLPANERALVLAGEGPIILGVGSDYLTVLALPANAPATGVAVVPLEAARTMGTELR
jgi:hypothetical protein